MSDRRWTPAQEQVILDAVPSDLLVTAAAGSGKTAVMVERIFQLVLNKKASVDQLIVSTFTNAAAASMKEKLSKLFDAYLAAHPADDYMSKQKLLLERANISTIHGFCNQLLKRYYFKTPLPPDFRVADDAEREMLEEAALEDTLHARYEQFENGQFPEMADALLHFCGRKKNDKGLREAVKALYNHLLLLPEPQAYLQRIRDCLTPGDTTWRDRMREYVDRRLRLMIGHLDYFRQGVKTREGAQEALGFLDEYEAYLRQCRAGFDTVKKRPSLKGPFKEIKDFLGFNTFDDERSDLKKFLKLTEDDDGLDSMRRAAEALIALETDYDNKLEILLLDRGLTTYGGLLRYTGVLLNDEKIRQDLQDSTKYIFIDEYQDVNELQDSILGRLSRGDNRFFVGDVKQSIYLFQHAVPRLFMEKSDRFAGGQGGHRLTLNNNFRSQKGILDAVNYLFRLWMHKGSAEIEYDDDACLYPGPAEDSPQLLDQLAVNGVPEKAAEVFLIPCQERPEDLTTRQKELLNEADNAREAEAFLSRVRELLTGVLYDSSIELSEEDKTLAKDAQFAKRFRPVRFGDIAVLAKKKNQLTLYENALRSAGIPFRVQTSDTSDPLCEQIVAFLRLLVSLDDDLSLTAVLFSPIGGFTAAEAGRIRKQHPDGSFTEAFRAYAALGAAGEKKERLMKRIEDYRLLSAVLSLPDLIEHFCRETGLVYVMAGRENAQEASIAYHRLLGCARKYTETVDGGLRPFLAYYEHTRDKQDRAAGEDETENVVRLMTIHHSKGLEYPIVFLVGLTKALRGSHDGAPVSFSNDSGMGFKRISEDTSGKRQENNHISKKIISIERSYDELAECLRLLYVAMTRAQSKLIMMLPATPADIAAEAVPVDEYTYYEAKSMADWIVPALLTHPDGKPLRAFAGLPDDPVKAGESPCWTVRSFLPPAKPEDAAESSAAAPNALSTADFDEKAYLDTVKAALDWHYDFEEATHTRAKRNPSKREDRLPPMLHKPAFDDREYTGAQKGTVVHYFMEHADFASANDARKQAVNMMYAGQLTQAEFDALPFAHLDAFFASPLAQAIRQADQVDRERSFCQIYTDKNNENSLVQGTIDCFFFKGETITLLDYKTDVIRGDLDRHVGHHRLQLEMYRAALRQFYPGYTVKAFLWFFDIDTAVDLDEKK